MGAGVTTIAVVPVRHGALPAGALEAIAEAHGRAVLIGSDTEAAVEAVRGVAGEVTLVETTHPRPHADAATLREIVAAHPIVILPGSADGRDLAPHLALAAQRELYAGATRIEAHRVDLVRAGGSAIETCAVGGEFVATLTPGVRGVIVDADAPPPTVRRLTIDAEPTPGNSPDAELLEELGPDASTMDLTEATRIVAAGGGLDDAQRLVPLGEVAAAIGASVGATRVITDRGWVDHARQIGTTGVVVDPRLYVAMGISGAVQHTSGLGRPDHIVAVNTDPYCPMMQMADLAIVADANAVLDALVAELAATGTSSDAAASEMATEPAGNVTASTGREVGG